MKTHKDGLKIKLIKEFFGHNNWRTKPLAIGRVLNYSANPQRALDLINKGIAIKYEQKNN